MVEELVQNNVPKNWVAGRPLDALDHPLGCSGVPIAQEDLSISDVVLDQFVDVSRAVDVAQPVQ